MVVAQITDLHVRPPGVRAYGVDTNAMLRDAVRAIAALQPLPDCVIATGDLTDAGLPEEYDELDDALRELPMPVFVIPGNHDRRDAMRARLAKRHDYLEHCGEYVQYVVDAFDVRLIALDTVVEGRTGGRICEAREAWLAAALAQGGRRPTLIFMHHAPFRTAVPVMDPLMCETSPTFVPLIERHPEIERVVAGHYHRPIVVRWAGTVGFVAPSTAHQVVLDLRDDIPNRYVLEPPALALHVFDAHAGMVTHVMPIGDFGPTHDFDDEGSECKGPE